MNERALDQGGPAVLEPSHWEVRVSGDDVDLRALAEVLDGPDLALSPRGSEFFLSIVEFAPLTDAGAVQKKAREIIDSMAGAAMVYLGMSTPIGMDRVIHVDGDKRHLFLFPDSVVLRARVLPVTLSQTFADGTVEHHRPADPVASALRMAIGSPVVRTVLRLRTAPELSWTELYRILEMIEEDVEKTGGTINASKAEIGRFTHSANSKHAAGDAGRHGREHTQPPKKPMTLDEARRIIDRIIRAWIPTK